MWHFPWIFWVVALLVWAMATRRRRWRRQWVMVGGPGCYPMPVLHDGTGTSAVATRVAPRRTREERDAEVEALESRIAELEERLDFTERLLAGRGREKTSPAE